MKLNEKQTRQENPVDQTAIATKNGDWNENEEKKNKIKEQQKERNNSEDIETVEEEEEESKSNKRGKTAPSKQQIKAPKSILYVG